MKIRFPSLTFIFALSAAVPASAQIGVPMGTPMGMPGVQDLPRPALDPVLDPLIESVLHRTDRLTGRLAREVEGLAQDRLRRIDRLVQRNRDIIERDARGEAARRGELLVMDANAADIVRAAQAGYRVIGQEDFEGLGIDVVRFALPRGTDLDNGQEALGRIMPDATISADNLYFQSGQAGSPAQQVATSPFNRGNFAPVGMIDGAPASAVPVTAMRSFADGGGTPSDHGSAIASLLRSAGANRIHAADVYGTDRAGGNALAIARALGWLAQNGARVVTISLVGPDNPVLARAIASTRLRGVVVVAAVGNDGPAAPPAYPASYTGVVAVTAVDRHERALLEAGRALHLDYSAPGANIYGLDRRGRSQRLRGTSYATPLVAARIAAALGRGEQWRSVLDEEAHDLGPRGADEIYGRGLVCRACAIRR